MSGSCVVWFLAALAVGSFLRLYMLSSQILLDDEWHSVGEALERSFLDVLTQVNSTSNAGVVLNLYNWLIYRGFHLSELALRLPSIAAGLAGLVLLPLAVRKVLGEGAALAFAFLLAVAPFLIFYSRFARSYSLAALLCLAALLAGNAWLATGRRRYAAGFILAGILAVYVHLFSVVTLFVPFATACGLLLAADFKWWKATPSRIAVSHKALLVVAVIAIVLLVPALRLVLSRGSGLPWAEGTLTLDGFATAATMISGTANVPLNILFFALCIAGHILLWRE
jgi:predicted membrane-bound mannosyltransferase